MGRDKKGSVSVYKSQMGAGYCCAHSFWPTFREDITYGSGTAYVPLSQWMPFYALTNIGVN